MKKISIYTKSGERAATTYYRIYQYIRNINGSYRYRKMLPDKMYRRVMPISSQNIFKKAYIFFYIIVRVFSQLCKDYTDRPDILIISRRFVNRILPVPYKWILNSLKNKGTKIIWDFDDQIIVSKEISKKGFNYMSALSDTIFVASPVNIDMIEQKYKDKAILLPTTDGDMYNLLTESIINERLSVLDEEIRLIWVGTSVSLKYVEAICPYLDHFATTMKSQYNKKVILTIVCNQSLNVSGLKHLCLRNILWERDVAISEMLKSHIGLMPLEKNNFNNGKGGFKLIQYLSVGLPIVGSPVGINKSIISNDVGVQVFQLNSNNWSEALENICINKDRWKFLSCSAKTKWQNEYNYNNNLKVWANELES